MTFRQTTRESNARNKMAYNYFYFFSDDFGLRNPVTSRKHFRRKFPVLHTSIDAHARLASDCNFGLCSKNSFQVRHVGLLELRSSGKKKKRFTSEPPGLCH